MKKIVVIVIVGLYLGSIFVVNFFGLNYVPHEMTVFVDKIECNTISDLSGKDIPYYQITQDPETQKDKKWFKIKFIEGSYTTEEKSLAENKNTFKINFSVFPIGANNKAVKLSYTPNDAKYIVDESQMTVTFLKRSTVEITIIADDGSGVSEMIAVEALKKV